MKRKIWKHTSRGETVREFLLEKTGKTFTDLANPTGRNFKRFEDAKKALSISVNGISSEFSEDALTPPDLKDLEIEYLKNKKEELISELNKIDSRLSEIKEQQNVK